MTNVASGVQAADSDHLDISLSATVRPSAIPITMKILNILWRRLVTPEGETCERCGGTHDAIVRALPKLEQALRPLGQSTRCSTCGPRVLRQDCAGRGLMTETCHVPHRERGAVEKQLGRPLYPPPDGVRLLPR
ncbi:MAG TPA: DUF2703 domain-containing protein [Thauera sp.]|nr:DUF2703 domain-containing protein [Thauera sp.]